MMRRSKNERRQLDGVLVLDKSIGMSSNQALQKVKRLYSANKAGHTGSLDPLATGVLPICFGEATKFSQFLLESDKQYKTSICLGVKTATGDKEGTVLETRPVKLSSSDVDNVLSNFVGESEQVPSMYSALKHNGQALYKLARQGIEVERKARKISIKQIELCEFTGTKLVITVLCSKGTYIRTLAEDIGEKLGCGAHVEFLRRLKAGPYELKHAFSLNELTTLIDQETRSCLKPSPPMMIKTAVLNNEVMDNLYELKIKSTEAANLDKTCNFKRLDEKLFPVDSAVSHFPEVYLDEQEVQSIVTGKSVERGEGTQIGKVRLYKQGMCANKVFIGVGEVVSCGLVTPKRLLKTSRFPKQ